MATEMGAIIILFPPNQEIIDYCSAAYGQSIPDIKADED